MTATLRYRSTWRRVSLSLSLQVTGFSVSSSSRQSFYRGSRKHVNTIVYVRYPHQNQNTRSRPSVPRNFRGIFPGSIYHGLQQKKFFEFVGSLCRNGNHFSEFARSWSFCGSYLSESDPSDPILSTIRVSKIRTDSSHSVP